MTDRWVETHRGRYPVTDEGTGAPVLLLHGFPDTRRVWRALTPLLVDAGHRVIALDLTGYGEAPRPAEVEAYEIPSVIADLIAVLDALEIGGVDLVGHDWGAATAWWMAGLHPERVDRLVAISVGHPMAPSWRSIPQREKTWYFWLFSSDDAERTLLAEDGRLLDDWLGGEGDWKEARLRLLGDREALTAALDWYRANTRAPWIRRIGGMPSIRCPVLGVWSDGDRFLLEPQMIESGDLVEGPWTYRRIEGASHWPQLDQPATLAAAMLGFLAS